MSSITAESPVRYTLNREFVKLSAVVLLGWVLMNSEFFSWINSPPIVSLGNLLVFLIGFIVFATGLIGIGYKLLADTST